MRERRRDEPLVSRSVSNNPDDEKWEATSHLPEVFGHINLASRFRATSSSPLLETFRDP